MQLHTGMLKMQEMENAAQDRRDGKCRKRLLVVLSVSVVRLWYWLGLQRKGCGIPSVRSQLVDQEWMGFSRSSR